MMRPSKPIESYPPVPPDELPPVPPTDPSGPSTATAAPAPVAPEAAALDFLAGAPRREAVTLAWPFRRDGEEVREVVVCRLSTAEVGALADQLFAAGARDIDLYEVYAAMTGLTPAVLRGLDADDGERVLAACRRLFPAALAPLAASATPAIG